MEAIISGQAGCFVLLDKQPLLCDLDTPDIARPVRSNEVGLIFRACSDAERVSVENFDQARDRCEIAWQKDRALRFALTLLEVDEDIELRLECGVCLEGLLRNNHVDAYVRERLLISPISLKLLSRAASDLDAFPTACRLFANVEALQPAVAQVRARLVMALAQIDDGAQRRRILELIEGSDAIATFVQATASGDTIEFFALQLMSRLRFLEGARSVIQQWMNLSGSSARKVDHIYTDDAEVDERNEHQVSGKVGRRAFESVMLQQKAILDRLRSGDQNGARRFVEELINNQSNHSTSEQLGKSLSRLSHHAKELGAHTLQVEWAQLAVEYSPTDALTFSHLADAFITTYQFAKAGETLNQLKEMGDKFTSDFGFARILRAQGRVEEARAAFLAICDAYPYAENISHARASAAETLRDMGHYEEALAEYEKLTQEHPLDGALWSGRAAVLMELGRMSEAVSTFRIAEQHGSGPIARSGRAAAHRYAGNFDEALKLYSQLAQEFPNECGILNGRAEVYRDRGDYESALRDFKQARRIAPFHPAPLFGVVKTLRDLGRYDEAVNLLDKEAKEFTYSAPLLAIRGSILMRQHQYLAALQTYDEISARFPLDFRTEKSRADALRRLGSFGDALSAYDSIITKYPFYDSAVLAKGALLIELGQFDRAESLLKVEAPISKFEWRKELLRAFLLESKGDDAAAEAALVRGVRKSPFYATRKMFKAALACRMLQKSNLYSARKIMEREDGEVSNVIRLHSLAASGRHRTAEEILKKILANTTEPRLLYLTQEIASRFQIIQRPSEKTREWIFEEERNALLLAVA